MQISPSVTSPVRAHPQAERAAIGHPGAAVRTPAAGHAHP